MKTHGTILVLLVLATACSSTETSSSSGLPTPSSSGIGSTSSGSSSSSSSGPTTSSGGAGACDAKAHCSSDGSGVETCSSEDGIPVTTTNTCSVGKCSDGECGACSTASDCKVAIICSCKDGSNVGVDESGTCPSKQCICSWGSCTLTTSVCPAKCADHGGWNSK